MFVVISQSPNKKSFDALDMTASVDTSALQIKPQYEFWKLDNYGFSIVDDEEEDKHIPELLRMYQPENSEKIQAQRVRWQKELQKRKFKLDRESTDIKNLCRKGVPPEMRGLVWFQISGAERRKAEKPNLYKELLEKHGNITTEATKQIDNDIDRTYP
jgi:hypothetical protein